MYQGLKTRRVSSPFFLLPCCPSCCGYCCCCWCGYGVVVVWWCSGETGARDADASRALGPKRRLHRRLVPVVRKPIKISI